MQYITPAILMIIIITALSMRRAVYSDFIDGAEDGIKLLFNIFPPLVAILVASSMLKASGALDIAINFLSPYAEKIGIPAGILPLCLIRPVSGSGFSDGTYGIGHLRKHRNNILLPRRIFCKNTG